MPSILRQDVTLCVSEFKQKQREVVQSFITGIVELGEILYRHREELKPQGVWIEYCNEIEIHISQANNYIRMYEYSKNSGRKEILDRSITNWSKLNLFLSLPEEVKDKVLDSSDITETTTSDAFREKVTAIRGELVPESIQVLDNVPTSNEEQINVSTMIQNPEETARLVVKKLGLSANARKPMTGLLYIEKWINNLESSDSLTEEDVHQLRELLQERMEMLNILLTTKYA